jgi:hypothetical protein
LDQTATSPISLSKDTLQQFSMLCGSISLWFFGLSDA